MRIAARVVSLGLCIAAGHGWAQDSAAPQTDGQTQTLHTTTQLVVLDATVFDKQGHLITVPLTRDDFDIQEDRKPQAIRYFESAAEHVAQLGNREPGKAPLLIAVLDELNFAYNPGASNAANIQQQAADYFFMRKELADFLESQPAQMDEPMEVLALTHHGFLVLAQPTNQRDTLIARVRQRDPGLGSPYRDYLEESPDATLTKDSLQAMWSLALQARSMPGRKLVLWLGYGGPDRDGSSHFSRPDRLTPFELYSRQVTDLLVDARVTLDVFRPGTNPGQPEVDPSAGKIAQIAASINSIGSATSFGFTNYVRATGGESVRVNDVKSEISQTIHYGTVYYTLSYTPKNRDFDRQFRRIRVTVKGHPDWIVLTKAGYYALQYGGSQDFEHQLQADLTVATYEAMPLSAIGATLDQVGRIQGTEERGAFTARFILNVDPADLQWQTNSQTNLREAQVAVSAAALGSVTTPDALASKAATWKLTTKTSADDKTHLKTTVTIELHVPAKTRRIRFVVRDLANGHMGTTDVGIKAVEAAPEVGEKQTLSPPGMPAAPSPSPAPSPATEP